MTAPRVPIDMYFMGIANQVATRSTCDRKHVGAIIVRDKMTLSTGYNGSIRGLLHCDDVGHMMEGVPQELDDLIDELRANMKAYGIQSYAGWLTQAEKVRERLQHCVRTVHAEANAIIQAARNGVRIDGGTIYTTASPCFSCFKLIANAGIVRIVFGELYRDTRVFEYAEKSKIELVIVE